MWSEYRSMQDENIDTVYVGSSTAQRSFDPAVIDARLGSSSFNMGTPAQQTEDSVLAAREASQDHAVKRVVLGIDFESCAFDEAVAPHVSFSMGRLYGKKPLSALSGYLELVTGGTIFGTSDSLGALFPAGYAAVHLSPSSVLDNVRRKLTYRDPISAAQASDPAWVYYGRGYGNYSYVIDYAHPFTHRLPSKDDPVEANERDLSHLEDLCTLCRERGIELVVVATPQPAFSILSRGEAYPRVMSRFKKVVEDGGGTFLDFNLARQDAYAPAEADFSDQYHLTKDGASAFSGTFADLLAGMEAGEDISGLFYSYDNWDEYLASVDCISAVTLDLVPTDGLTRAVATPYAGRNVQMEYQFLLLDKETGAYEVAQDWSGNKEFALDMSGGGSVMVRVRRVGSDAEYERLATCSF